MTTPLRLSQISLQRPSTRDLGLLWHPRGTRSTLGRRDAVAPEGRVPRAWRRPLHHTQDEHERDIGAMRIRSHGQLRELRIPPPNSELLRTEYAVEREPKATEQMLQGSTEPRCHQSNRIAETRSRLALLRSLLRETTYLPDPASRIYIRAYILSRYRAFPHGNAYHANLHPEGEAAQWRGTSNQIRGSHNAGGFDKRQTQTPEHEAAEAPAADDGQAVYKHPLARETAKTRQGKAKVEAKREEMKPHSRARHGLRALQKANQGYPLQVLRTLLFTYGRTGKRRFELLQPLLRPATAEETSANPLLKAVKSNLHPQNLSHVPPLSAPLVCLLRSQHRQKTLDGAPHSSDRIKTIELELPKENSYKRPLPQRRAINQIRAHYAELLDRALPPVSREEFDSLAALASPHTTTEDLVARGVLLDRRRRRMGVPTWPDRGSRGGLVQAEPEDLEPTSEPAEADDKQLRVEDYDDSTYRLFLSDRNGDSDLDLEVQSQTRFRRTPRGKNQPHEFTKRWMQRLYALAFRITPTMEWDTQMQRWNVKWGEGPVLNSKHEFLVRLVNGALTTAKEDEPRLTPHAHGGEKSQSSEGSYDDETR